ncbi:MAG TPA: D-2-hydroxyacid dehydrogenase [Planctomycetota bacterium]|nr:D-2-hydroxyacid dehydrogenase [Planctomycetota bacterium]
MLRSHFAVSIVAFVALWAAACLAVAPTQSALSEQVPPPAVPKAPSSIDESLGSLRNARIAFVTDGRPVPLTYLAGETSTAELAELKALAPNVRVLSGLSRQQALEHAGEVQGADARFLTPEFLAAANRLVWVQAMGAGVDRLMALRGLVDEDRIVLTNLRGVHGPAIAEHVFATLLFLTRDLRFHVANQATGTWGREGSAHRPIALQGKTMLVVGLGGIGGEVAERAHGLRMHVLATRRSDTASPAWIEHVGKPEELLALLPRADVVVVCAPLTPETEHLFGREAFGAMKPGAYFVNIARGRIVDTRALHEALRDGRLAGACLDVTDPEPLPADHPLWKLDNVVITPHVSNDSELTDERSKRLFHENFRRFGAGEPLFNVVDKRAGY